MNSLESLMREHRVIERAVNLLEEVALRLHREEAVDVKTLTLLLFQFHVMDSALWGVLFWFILL